MSYINFMFVLFSLKTCQHSGSEPSALELKISIMNNKILINNFNLEKCIIFKIIGKHCSYKKKGNLMLSLFW